MHCIENADTSVSRGFQNLHLMRNTLVAFSNTLYAIPYFPALGNEVVIGIDHNKSSDLLLVCQLCHPAHLFGYAVKM